MTIDILFLAKNRLEFTRQSLAALLANTNWSRVGRLILKDDGSTDGTADLLRFWQVEFNRAATLCLRELSQHGSPAGAMNAFANYTSADVFVKLDNDVIVPPGWLDHCAAVMQAHPELDLLGIEPPASRVPSRPGMKPSPQPEFDTSKIVGAHHTDGEMIDGKYVDQWVPGYAPCDSIGGVGLMRTRCFLDREPIKPYGIYGGFTDWQLAHKEVVKGWCVPPLKCFLLDRLPMEPWASLSHQYEVKQWQRAWGRYPMSAKDQLWGWWEPVK